MSTHSLSQQQLALSCNMQTQIRQAIDSTGQPTVAKCIGIDTTAITKMKSAQGTAKHGDIERICHLLAVCGLKIVPANTKHYDAAKIEILFRITKDHFQRLDAVDDFFQNDAGMYDANDAVRYSRTSDLSDVKTAPNTVSAILTSFCEACKSLAAPKSNVTRPTILVARLNTANEIKQERHDIEADDSAFWKMTFILCNIVGFFILLAIAFEFWG